eukprot:5758182-Pyramimonas_sp.AAC.1
MFSDTQKASIIQCINNKLLGSVIKTRLGAQEKQSWKTSGSLLNYFTKTDLVAMGDATTAYNNSAKLATVAARLVKG